MRGLTLLEVLISLTLLTMLSMASLSWIESAMRLTSESVEPMEWERSARAVLSLIHDDAATGDFDSPDESEQEPLISFEDGILEIHTRSRLDSSFPVGIPIVHRFVWSEDSHELRFEEVLQESPAASLTQESEREDSKRLLLEGVTRFDIHFAQSPHSLSVVIGNDEGRKLSHFTLLPYARSKDPEEEKNL